MSGSVIGTLRSLYATLRQAMAKPSTVEFPFVKRPRAARIRASFALTKDDAGDENCIGCKKCEKVCPSEVITVVASKKPSPVTGKARGYADDFTLNLQACIICELCVQVCPTDAIVMMREQEPPGFSRESLTLTMGKLYANGAQKERRSWASATVLADQQKQEEKTAVAAAQGGGSVPPSAAADSAKGTA